jgi:hypothetical protein
MNKIIAGFGALSLIGGLAACGSGAVVGSNEAPIILGYH